MNPAIAGLAVFSRDRQSAFVAWFSIPRCGIPCGNTRAGALLTRCLTHGFVDGLRTGRRCSKFARYRDVSPQDTLSNSAPYSGAFLGRSGFGTISEICGIGPEILKYRRSLSRIRKYLAHISSETSTGSMRASVWMSAECRNSSGWRSAPHLGNGFKLVSQDGPMISSSHDQWHRAA